MVTVAALIVVVADEVDVEVDGAMLVDSVVETADVTADVGCRMLVVEETVADVSWELLEDAAVGAVGAVVEVLMVPLVLA